MRKKGFTLEQHREVGARLGAVRDEYQKLAILIAITYGETKYGNAITLIDSLDQLKSDLDTELFEEHPEMDTEAKINIYYGNRSGKKDKEAP